MFSIVLKILFKTPRKQHLEGGDFSGEIVPRTYQNVSLARHLFENCEPVEMTGEIYGIFH